MSARVIVGADPCDLKLTPLDENRAFFIMPGLAPTAERFRLIPINKISQFRMVIHSYSARIGRRAGGSILIEGEGAMGLEHKLMFISCPFVGELGARNEEYGAL